MFKCNELNILFQVKPKLTYQRSKTQLSFYRCCLIGTASREMNLPHEKLQGSCPSKPTSLLDFNFLSATCHGDDLRLKLNCQNEKTNHLVLVPFFFWKGLLLDTVPVFGAPVGSPVNMIRAANQRRNETAGKALGPGVGFTVSVA